MIWNNIAKPSVLLYTNLNPQGKEQYNQSSITYDESSTYYDGTNMSQWTDISKPSVPSWTSVSKPV